MKEKETLQLRWVSNLLKSVHCNKLFCIDTLHFRSRLQLAWTIFRTITPEKYHCTADLLFIFIWIQLLGLCWINNQFTCLVESKPVKQEVSHTVILPYMVSVLWSHPLKRVHFQKAKLGQVEQQQRHHRQQQKQQLRPRSVGAWSGCSFRRTE